MECNLFNVTILNKDECSNKKSPCILLYFESADFDVYNSLIVTHGSNNETNTVNIQLTSPIRSLRSLEMNGLYDLKLLVKADKTVKIKEISEISISEKEDEVEEEEDEVEEEEEEEEEDEEEEDEEDEEEEEEEEEEVVEVEVEEKPLKKYIEHSDENVICKNNVIGDKTSKKKQKKSDKDLIQFQQFVLDEICTLLNHRKYELNNLRWIREQVKKATDYKTIEGIHNELDAFV
jgi:hypothetical protein